MGIKFISYFILSLILISSCKKKDESAPHISTTNPSQVTSYTIKTGGSALDNGPILEKGVCWSNDRIPDISDAHMSAGSGSEDFNLTVNDLEPNMTYYLRAYATNKYRTGYGNVVIVKTALPPTLPVLQTYYPSSVAQTAATCSALLQSITNKPISSIGFCWSTHSKPKVSDFSKTYTASVLTGFTYSTVISGLDKNTTYYLRAFAVNSDGTSYGNEVIFKTSYGTVTDYNGNVYGTVLIGGKEWMTENLRVNRFNDGTSIPFISDNYSWSTLSTSGYCNYNNSSTTLPAYGKLYNWYCVSSSKNIAPVGWHVSTYSDWQSLINELGADSTAIKIKISSSQYWYYDSATNQSGLSAIAAGYCDYSQYFYDLTYGAYFWLQGSSIEGISVTNSNNYLYKTTMGINSGLSIRCVKD